MSEPLRARVRVPRSARAGEEIILRVMATHPMESGNRPDPEGGFVPRRMIHRFVCDFDGETVIDMEIGTGISANPVFEFTARVDRSGRFGFAWYEDGGAVHRESATISIG